MTPQTSVGVNVDEVIEVKTDFVTKSPLVLYGNPARKLPSRDRAKLLKIINQTRTGKKHFVIEVDYIKQTDAAPRINGPDNQAPSSLSKRTHVGLLVKAEQAGHGGFYITLLDYMRQDNGRQGFTSMRLEGITRLEEVKATDGPLPPKP